MIEPKPASKYAGPVPLTVMALSKYKLFNSKSGPNFPHPEVVCLEEKYFKF